MIAPGFIQDLLSRVDIVEVVGRHVELKKSGINPMGLCPFHGEKSPSFSVAPAKQFYHCFGCGVSGDAIKFLTELTGMSFREAVESLAQDVGMIVPDDDRTTADRERSEQQKQKKATLSTILQQASDHYRSQLKKTPRAIDYLKGRGLSGRVAAQFGLGFAPDSWRPLASAMPSYDDPLLVESGMVIVKGEAGDAGQSRYDRFRDRIMFPIRNVTGEFIGFGGRVLDKGEPKYLNSPETPVFSKGRELYGLFEARGATQGGLRQRGYALVVEGYMDVVALAQHGFANAVATLGTACTAEHVQKLFRFTESVVFSFDGDAAGRRAAGRALEAALPLASDTRTVKFLFLPTEHDPDSYVRELGAEAFERCVAEAVPLSRQMMDLAAEGCDLGSAEGRARFLATARPLWQALPTGLLKRQMLGELARKAQLPDQELMTVWQVGQANSSPAPPSNDDGAPPDYHDAISQSGPTEPMARRPPKPPWKKDWQPGGDWKQRRREAEDETRGLPRRQPAGPAEHTLRLLLLASDWWGRLNDADHALLHALPAPHGELIAWLERHLMHHGAGPWSVLEVALVDVGLRELAERATGGMQREDEPLFEDLQRHLKTLWVNTLSAETRQIINSNPQGEALQHLQVLNRQIIELNAALKAMATGT